MWLIIHGVYSSFMYLLPNILFKKKRVKVEFLILFNPPQQYKWLIKKMLCSQEQKDLVGEKDEDVDEGKVERGKSSS